MTFEPRLEGEEGASHVDICREQILGQGNSYCKAPREGAARRPVWLDGRAGRRRERSEKSWGQTVVRETWP